MATKLDKDLIRESTVSVEGREIVLTLSADQSIKMKLKGMKSGEVSIDIEQLYNQLTGNVSEPIKVESKPISIINDDEDDEDDEDYGKKPSKGAILIDLHDLRSMNAISTLDINTLSKFDGIIADLIKQKKEVIDATSTANRPVAVVKAKKKTKK